MNKDRKVEYIESVVFLLVAIGCFAFPFYTEKPIGNGTLEETRALLWVTATCCALCSLTALIGDYRLNFWFRSDFREKQIMEDPDGRYTFYDKENIILLRVFIILAFIASITALIFFFMHV